MPSFSVPSLTSTAYVGGQAISLGDTVVPVILVVDSNGKTALVRGDPITVLDNTPPFNLELVTVAQGTNDPSTEITFGNLNLIGDNVQVDKIYVMYGTDPSPANATSIEATVGVDTYTVSGLTPNTLYNCWTKALDAASNQAGPTPVSGGSITTAEGSTYVYGTMSEKPAGWTETIFSRCTDTFEYKNTVVHFPDPDIGTQAGYDGGSITLASGVDIFDMFKDDTKAATLGFWIRRVQDSVRTAINTSGNILTIHGSAISLSSNNVTGTTYAVTTGEWVHLTFTKDAGASTTLTMYVTGQDPQKTASFGSKTWASMTSFYWGQGGGAPIMMQLGNIYLANALTDAAGAQAIHDLGKPDILVYPVGNITQSPTSELVTGYPVATLTNSTSFTVSVVFDRATDEDGVLFETGNTTSGSILYVFGNNLYVQVGDGSSVNNASSIYALVGAAPVGKLQQVDLSASVNGSQVGKVAVYINGSLQFSQTKTITADLGSSDAGGIGRVYTATVSNLGGWSANGSGKFGGTIRMGYLWNNIVTSDASQ